MHPGTIHRLVWGALWISALTGGMAHAQLTAIVAVEPTPDGQVKFPHPWPPQIPPGRTAGL